MSRKRKGKYQPLQSKKKKSRPSPLLAVSRQATAPRVEESVAAVSAVDVKPAAVQTPMAVKTPGMLVELQRIGILAAIMLVALIILVLVLD